jgi:glycosyltransferase involved in cell wall biosynthesis
VKKTRVSFVASTFAVGGSERVMSELITRLPVADFTTRLYFLREPGPVGRELFRRGVRGAERLQRHRLDPMVLPRLARYLEHDGADVLFVLDHHNALLWGRLAGLAARVPHTVVASHTTGRLGGRKSFRTRDRWLMEFTDRVVALSRTHAAYLHASEGIAPGKIAVVENGVSLADYAAPEDGVLAALRRELGLEEGDRVVLMVAAFRPEKSHETLLEAAELLVVEGRCPTFLVVGDGARRREIESLAASMGLLDRVRFLGVRADVARLLHLGDALVLPSKPAVETLPMCVLEAMAAGVPVIASRVGSVPEVIEDGRSGLLIAPTDAVELARAIGYIVDNPAAARGMAETARARVKDRYTVESMVERYARLFESLVAA